MHKKGQAAMEFLMTYGWAILVVLIAIGALAYFGVLNPSRFLPNKCTFSAGVSCGDFILDNSAENLVLRLTNNLGETVNIADGAVVVTNVESGVVCTEDVAFAGTPSTYTWQDGQTIAGATTNQLLITDCGITTAGMPVGQRYRMRVDITYTGSSGLAHTVTGDITGRAEA